MRGGSCEEEEEAVPTGNPSSSTLANRFRNASTVRHTPMPENTWSSWCLWNCNLPDHALQRLAWHNSEMPRMRTMTSRERALGIDWALRWVTSPCNPWKMVEKRAVNRACWSPCSRMICTMYRPGTLEAGLGRTIRNTTFSKGRSMWIQGAINDCNHSAGRLDKRINRPTKHNGAWSWWMYHVVTIKTGPSSGISITECSSNWTMNSCRKLFHSGTLGVRAGACAGIGTWNSGASLGCSSAKRWWRGCDVDRKASAALKTVPLTGSLGTWLWLPVLEWWGNFG